MRSCALWLALGALSLATATPAAAQTHPLDGRWDVTVEGASRSGMITLILGVQESRVTGRREVHGEPTLPVAGEIRDDQMVLRFTVQEDGLELPVEIRATLSSDRLEGEAEIALPGGRSVVRGWAADRAVDNRATAGKGKSQATAGSLAEVLRLTLAIRGQAP